MTAIMLCTSIPNAAPIRRRILSWVASDRNRERGKLLVALCFNRRFFRPPASADHGEVTVSYRLRFPPGLIVALSIPQTRALPLLRYPIWVSTSLALPARLDACGEPKEVPMTCQRCQGCMARDHFLDLQESGGDWWLEGWRCINCGNVFDPVLERNRRLHAAALTSANVQPALSAQPVVEEDSEHSSDIAA